MKKNKQNSENYLDFCPMRNEALRFSTENGLVTLEIDNKGIMNTIAQKLFKKPKTSFIHLDEMGSFIWPLLDGEKTIFELGKDVEEKFGEDASPLYERLSQYIRTLVSYGFVTLKKSKNE